MFSDVDCGPCEYLSPPLVELAEKKAGKVQVLMITRGDEERNKEKAQAFGYTFSVLLQKSWEISKLYGMFATPIGYLIDKDGMIAKEVAVGPVGCGGVVDQNVDAAEMLDRLLDHPLGIGFLTDVAE